MVLWKNNFELSLEGNEIFLGPLQHFLGRAHFLPQPIINQKAREKKNRGKSRMQESNLELSSSNEGNYHCTIVSFVTGIRF